MEKDLIKQIITHLDNISGGLEIVNHQPSISKKEFEEEITNIEKFNNAPINSLLSEIWRRFNGQIFMNEVGIKSSEKIPALESDDIIEFRRFFSIAKSGDYILEMIKSNSDIFGNKFIPFAEALEGDFFTFNNEDNAIYYIMHDFGSNEKYAYKIANNVELFFLSLINIEPLSNQKNSLVPEIISTNLSKSLLFKLQEFKLQEFKKNEK
jgi:hypothetical protein